MTPHVSRSFRPAVSRMVLLLSLCGLPTAAFASAPVLPPSAATQVTALLDLDRPLADGATLGATIEKAQIVVTVGEAAAPRMRVTLLHPDVAPAGAFRVGSVALVPRPGPAPEADVAAVRERLQAKAGELGWVRPSDSPKPPPPPDETAAREAMRKAVETASARLVRMDPKGALEALAAVPAPKGAEPLLAYAIAVHGAGDRARAAALVEELPRDASPSVRAVASWIAGRVQDEATLLGYWPEGKVDCAAADAAHSLHQLGDAKLAAALSRAVRTADPACRVAWIAEMRARSDLPRDAEAEATASAALQRFPGDVDVLDAAASMSRRLKDFERAIARYEQLGAIEPPRPRVLGHLSNAIMHSKVDREEALARYEALLKANANDDVARFMVGVLLHYGDEYERSNEVFTPLIGRRDSEDRLWVYMAMNDFNLGKRQQALDTLNRIAKKPHPDPDVYYCRAEIMRDVDRAGAAQDLRLYLAGSGGKDPAHAAKEARVARMIAALEQCQQTNPAVCEGEWEHPRKERVAAARNQRLLAVGGGVGALLLVAFLLLRRRRGTA